MTKVARPFSGGWGQDWFPCRKHGGKSGRLLQASLPGRNPYLRPVPGAEVPGYFRPLLRDLVNMAAGQRVRKFARPRFFRDVQRIRNGFSLARYARATLIG